MSRAQMPIKTELYSRMHREMFSSHLLLARAELLNDFAGQGSTPYLISDYQFPGQQNASKK